MDITLTLKCSNNCVFCPRREYLKAIACRSPQEIKKSLERTRRVSDRIVFSGGEVTLMDDLPGIAAFAKKLAFAGIGVITNGRALKDKGLALKLILAGANDFAVSVYSTRSGIHDRVTRKKGSARETLSGLANLLDLSRRYDVSVRVNMVLCRWNRNDMIRSIRDLYQRGVRNFIVAEQIVIGKKIPSLSLEDVKAALGEMTRLRLKNTRLVLRGFPFCLAPRRGSRTEEGMVLRKSNPFLLLEKHEADTLAEESARKKIYIKLFTRLFTKKREECRECSWSFCCQGIQKAYLPDGK